MRWTRVRWTALVALLCAATGAPPPARAAIRVLAFPKSSHVPLVHPTSEEPRPRAPDMLECLMAASYTCVQRKTAVYLDALNRLDRIRLLGDFVTAVRTRPVDGRTPAVSEPLLDARGFNDVLSLSFLVDSVFRDMLRSHALRVSFPRIADFGAPYALEEDRDHDDDDGPDDDPSDRPPPPASR